MRLRGHALVIAVFTVALADAAAAKTFAVRSPSGRTLYDAHETFDEVMDQNRRTFVIEVAVGAGAEGNLGLLLGWMPKAIKGWEFYGGVGLEASPAAHYTFAVRRLFNIAGYRPFASLGYLFRRQGGIATDSHNAFAEVGYSWRLHQTYHVTLGVGLRYMAALEVQPDSPLRAPEIDPVFLRQELDAVERWTPIGTLRFSRAF